MSHSKQCCFMVSRNERLKGRYMIKITQHESLLHTNYTSFTYNVQVVKLTCLFILCIMWFCLIRYVKRESHRRHVFKLLLRLPNTIHQYLHCGRLLLFITLFLHVNEKTWHTRHQSIIEHGTIMNKNVNEDTKSYHISYIVYMLLYRFNLHLM